MKNLIYNEDTYFNIFEYKPDTLIKFSRLPIYTWETLSNKKLYCVNSPIKVCKLTNEEQRKFRGFVSKVYLPKLVNYETLFNETFTRNFTTKDILLLLRKNLLALKYLHENKVIHGDLYPHNIMINKDFDISFIDFEASIIDGDIPEENIRYEALIPDKTKIKLAKSEDKTDVLDIYMYYLIYGNFKRGEMEISDISKLGLSKSLEMEIQAYINHDVRPGNNCYFLSLVDELLKLGYESKVLEKRIKH